LPAFVPFAWPGNPESHGTASVPCAAVAAVATTHIYIARARRAAVDALVLAERFREAAAERISDLS
jgi:hypothetical protein